MFRSTHPSEVSDASTSIEHHLLRTAVLSPIRAKYLDTLHLASFGVVQGSVMDFFIHICSSYLLLDVRLRGCIHPFDFVLAVSISYYVQVTSFTSSSLFVH